jgi:hypothetical protein
MYLLADEQSVTPGGRASRLAGWLRLAVLAGVWSFFAVYLLPRNSTWNVIALAAPLTVLTAGLAARDWRGIGAAWRPLLGIAWCALGAALPLVAYAADYAAHGLFGAFWLNVVVLPRWLRWFMPFPVPGAPALILAVGYAAALASVRLRRASPTVATVLGLSLLLSAGAAAGLALTGKASVVWHGSNWHGLIFLGWTLVPICFICFSRFSLISA